MEIVQLPIKNIVPDENQPRKLFNDTELAHLISSIKKYGVMEPLKVQAIDKGMYLLIDGERRFRAATDAGLKELPAVIMDASDPVTTLIKQFQLQEMHQSWTPTEKAMAVYKLSKELKTDLVVLAEMLGLDRSTIKRYLAFSDIILKQKFERANIQLGFALQIGSIKRTVKAIYFTTKQDFSRAVQSEIEDILIYKIKMGLIKTQFDFTKIKDSFNQTPQMIQVFLSDPDITPEALFIKANAKGSYYLRNAVNKSAWLADHITGILEEGTVALTPDAITNFKRVKTLINEVLNRAGE